MNEKQAREQILELVKDYCETYHNQKKEYEQGDRIPYASRVYDSEEMVNLVDSALEFWLTSGRYTAEFEKGLSEFLGVKYCALVNSGSSANLLAFMALTSPLLGERAIGRGDEVITVAAGFPTTVAPIVQYGAVPVFIDVTIPQYNLDVSMLEKALSDRTKAVMAAHTLGNPFDLKAVREFCDRHNLWLIENNCDALGATYLWNGEERFDLYFVHRNYYTEAYKEIINEISLAEVAEIGLLLGGDTYEYPLWVALKDENTEIHPVVLENSDVIWYPECIIAIDR